MNICKVILSLALMFVVSPVYAQNVENTDAQIEKRIELAREIQNLRPARQQIESAITRYTARLPAQKRESMAGALRGVFNYKALEKASIDAYVETYTQGELQAMFDYYSTPEAQSAVDKANDYAALVYPEIIRMLDQAMMRVKTGGTTGQ